MRALRRFTVRAALPEPLFPLGQLVGNLRWSWHAPTLDLFASVDPQTWTASGADPLRLLGAIGRVRLDELAEDAEFLHRLTAAYDDLQDYLSRPRWYQELTDVPKAIAYFSPEFGITEVLPQYSGGLGILAGDHLKTASDLGVPIIGVGLLYRRGYFRQSLSREGWQQERYPPIDPHGLPLSLLRDPAGTPIHISVGLPDGHTLKANIWRADVGRVPLLLLDSDIEENAPAERDVTDRLYGGGSDHRLLQEMLLGIGGVRAVRAFCSLTGHAEPEVFHTNEGHAGFLGLERIRELVDAHGMTFDEALEAVRAGTVFTTHTPVPAGIDRFPVELIETYFGGKNECPGLPVERILALGAETYDAGDPDVFNMAVMGLRLAQRANGVSRLHGEVSREMFRGLWPGFDLDEIPLSHVTNGVHAPTWVAREVMALAEQVVGPELTQEAQGWEGIDKVPDDAIWGTRRLLRERLVREVRTRLRISWRQRGSGEAETAWIDDAFDPDVLTIGFARRVPSYKRLTLMLRDSDRLTALLTDPNRPVQIVVAGKAHPADDGGKALIQEIVRFADSADVRHRIAFLPDYDMALARLMVSGCDVWLNNPLRPLEACGTSGMKAALNGGLNLSVLDGWWDEMFDGANGWALPSADVSDPDRRDDLEAAALYDIVEQQLCGRFYDRDGDGLPRRWIEMVRHTLRSLGPKVLASRMLRDYVVQLYAPAARASQELAESKYSPARDLAIWRTRVRRAWPQVRIAHAEAMGATDILAYGDQLTVRVVAELGELTTDDVDVQVAYGWADETDELRRPTIVSLTRVGPAEGGGVGYEGRVPLAHAGSFGYTVRVVPTHPLLPTTADLGLVALPPREQHYTEEAPAR